MTDLSITSDEGSSVPLQRWLDVLRGGLRSTTDAVAGLSSSATGTPAAQGVAREVRLPWSLDHTDRATLRTALLSEPDRDRRTSRAALDAHAAAGELEVQRAAYAGLERALADSAAAVRQHLDRLDTAPTNARRDSGEPSGEAAATRARDDASARPAAATDRSAALAAGIDAATEVAKGRDRLVELRDRALAEAREVTVRVNALADDVAADNRRVAERNRAQARSEAARADAAAAQDARAEALQARDRRDQAVREIARLTGATAVTNDDGTVEVRIADRPVVDAEGVHPVAVQLTPARQGAAAAGQVGLSDPLGSFGVTPRRRDDADVPVSAVVSPRVAADGGVAAAEVRRGPDRVNVSGAAAVDDVTQGTAATSRFVPLDAGAQPMVPRLITSDGSPVEHPGGRIAAQLDQATRVLPDALARWEQVGAAVAATVAAATRADGVATTSGASSGARPDRDGMPLPVSAAGAAARATLEEVAASLEGRSQTAERRLDVMSVVDAVLVGAPISQVGGLVSTALGGRAEGVTPSGRSGQQLITALQAVDAVTTAMGRTAETAAAELARIPLTLTSSNPAVVAVTALPVDAAANPFEGAAAGRGAASGQTAAADGSLSAVTSAPTQLPRAGLDADVIVVSAARATAIASSATFDPAARFERSFAFGLSVSTGQGSSRGVVTVPAGAGIDDVATAVNEAGLGVRAATVPVGDGSVRLMVAAENTGSDVTIRVSDGYLPGRASDAIGAFSRVQRGADTVITLTAEDQPARTSTSATPYVDDAVPGVRLTIGAGGVLSAQSAELGAPAGPTLAPVRISARPDAAIAAQHAGAMVAGAAAVLDTIRGRGAVAAPAAAALNQDPVVGVVAANLSTALAGNTENDQSGPGQQLLGRWGRRPAHGALPGLSLDAQDRVRFDARTFQQAFMDDSVRVTAQLQAVADDLVRIATEATDPRSGALAVRIQSEQGLAQEYSGSTGDVDDRSKYRQDVLEGRAAAMTSLLERLSDEQRWLDLQVR